MNQWSVDSSHWKMAEEIALEMEGFTTFKGLWPWPWLWIGSYCIPSCITHRPLPTCQILL